MSNPAYATFTPDEAAALLARLSPDARQLLAMITSILLCVEEVPGVSYPPDVAPAADELIAAGVAIGEPADNGSPEAVAHRTQERQRYDAWWGPTPPDLPTVAMDYGLIGLVCALLSGHGWDGAATIDLSIKRDPRLRVYERPAATPGNEGTPR